MSRTRTAKTVTISVTGDLTVAYVAEHRDAFAARLTDGAEHVVDLSAVDELDTAGLQLLLVLTREIERRGRLGAVSCSPTVVEVLAAAGLGPDVRPLGAEAVPA